jgi:hypothetical protein
MSKINLNESVFFYDDRNKYDIDYRLTEIKYQDDKVCLCKAVPIVRPDSQLAENIEKANDGADVEKWWERRIDAEETILFDIESGEVLIKELDSWYATNDVTVGGEYEDATKELALNQ